ncbi:ATP-grasp domain-containing protein [Serratia ureilytica]|uniref:ATP-grasp domain-containing protein n=1 Tax=Serratia ureilytica TaxID=300181 RepID=UPI0019D1701B|nr:ATP-grasp domain-containing protein [Serratia ureilytica]MBN5216149.1 ATP-grasp domain-containing protein [Serratia ureilytica]
MDIKDTKKIVILVDAYSSGNDVAPEFNKKGYGCAHIQSREDIPAKLLNSYRGDDFFISLQYTGDEILNQLQEYDVIAVIAGCETGIELADHLAELLDLPGNDTGTSRSRRNKYLMQECLKNSAINHIPTHRLTTLKDATQYATELFKKYRKLVLKPVDSAGTDSVFVCKTVEEVEAHSGDLFKKSNQLNLKNEVIILQPFIEGEEYVVDTVSYQGRHKICAIWKMGKGSYNGADSICEFTELTSFDAQNHAQLKDYIFSCLDALGITFGAAHSELFLTKDGWTLIETGARPHGAGFPALSSLALKRTQIDELVLSVCSTEAFLEAVTEEYKPLNYLKIKELISFSAGTIKAVKHVDTIAGLPSYKKSNLPDVDQEIKLTTDVYSSPGWIALSHRCADQLNADYQYIVGLESKGMFEVYEH